MGIRCAFIGFGNVAREFVKILQTREADNPAERRQLKVTAIATANHGCATLPCEAAIAEVVRIAESGGNVTELPGAISRSSGFEVIETCNADVVFETSPLNATDGQPAIDHIRSALARRMHVITANKGPVAFAYRELNELAARYAVQFRFEGAVMDGAPVFNLVETCLPGTRVLGFEGVLNSTSNLVLTMMESGSSFDEALAEAKRRGIAEADPSYDIDGWDSALKAVALAVVLMNSQRKPAEVKRTGIRDLSADQLHTARASGQVFRPMVKAAAGLNGVDIIVRPELVPADSIFAAASGTSNVLLLKTDLMGELAVFEKDPGVRQTAYALLSDLLRIYPA